jgi:hypothetical protein
MLLTPEALQCGFVPSGPDAIGATYATLASGAFTIPAPAAGLSLYLRSLDVRQYATAATVASGTPALMTSSGLPGNPSLPMSTAVLAQGSVTPTQWIPKDLKASLPATAIVLTFPAITGISYYVTATWAVGT